MTRIEAEKTDILNLIIAGYNYVAFFSDYDIPASTDFLDSGNKNEIGRVALTNKDVTNDLFTADYTLLTTDCNCPTTTVATYAGNTTTLFKVASSTNLKVNDRIQVGSNNDRKIIAKDAVNHYITVDAPLTAIPTNGTAVKVKISQRAVLRGGTGTAYSGTLAEIERFILYKSDTISKKGSVSLKI